MQVIPDSGLAQHHPQRIDNPPVILPQQVPIAPMYV